MNCSKQMFRRPINGTQFERCTANVDNIMPWARWNNNDKVTAYSLLTVHTSYYKDKDFMESYKKVWCVNIKHHKSYLNIANKNLENDLF